jgi:hypothetical protein
MKRNLFNQLATCVFATVVWLAFFRAYRDPERDWTTRALNRYADAMTARGTMSPRTWLLITSTICGAVALMCLLFALLPRFTRVDVSTRVAHGRAPGPAFMSTQVNRGDSHPVVKRQRSMEAQNQMPPALPGDSLLAEGGGHGAPGAPRHSVRDANAGLALRKIFGVAGDQQR